MISIQEADQLVVHHGATILDIRSMIEYCGGHICGSTLVATGTPPLNSAQTRALKAKLLHILQDHNDYHPIIVYCKKGIRSTIAYGILQESGFYNVFNMGGIENKPLIDFALGKITVSRLRICTCKK